MRTRTAYVAFQTAAESPLTVAGRLCLPMDVAVPTERLAAVVICHGSDGVDGRGDFHAPFLHEAGIATLEIDMWATRGAAARPASPIETLPDAFAALAFLGAQPEIDPGRIGVMGFSWGGVVTLLSATRRHADPLRGSRPAFAAHAALYPVCWAYSRLPALALTDLTGAPILIQTGEVDAYDTPGAGERLAAALRASGADVRGIAHQGATHGFDRDLAPQTIEDPFAHERAGGPVLMEFNAAAAAAARGEIVRFFQRTLAPNTSRA